jgi:hypothetical protein
MDVPGVSAAGLHRDLWALLEGDSQTDSGRDCQFDFPADSHRRSQADLRRDLQGDLQEDFHGDFVGVSRDEGGVTYRGQLAKVGATAIELVRSAADLGLVFVRP